MSSKYAQASKSYVEQTSFFGYGDKARRAIYISKKEPNQYLQFIDNEFLVVPFHNFVTTRSGKTGNFICRHFINKDCFICDNIRDEKGNQLKPKRTYLITALKFEMVGRRKFKPILEDIVVSKKAGEAVIDKYKNLDYDISNDAVTFHSMPSIGILVGNKSIDEGAAVAQTQFGSLDDQIFYISRQGEGINTKYSAIRIDDSDYDTNSDRFKAASELIMNIDDYIDSYISEDLYNRSFGLDEEKPVSNEDDSDDYDDDDDSDSESDEDINEAIAKLYGNND